jgi:uncharacterized protein (TIGR02246 family)
MKRNAVIVLLVALMAGCAAPEADTTEAAKAGIDAGNATLVAGFNAGDAEMQASVYTDDAMVMAPNQPTAIGMEAIVEMMKTDADTTGMVSMELETVGVTARGDMAHEIGTYTVFAGGEEVDHGKYMAIWKDVDGTWKIHRDIWNSSVPVPKPAEETEVM